MRKLEFGDNPGDIRFTMFRYVLEDVLKKAAKELTEVSGQVGKISKAVDTVSKQGGGGS